MFFLKKILTTIVIILFFSVPHLTHAQSIESYGTFVKKPQVTYYKAKVIKLISEGKKIDGDFTSFYQVVLVELLEGKNKRKQIKVEQGGLIEITPSQLLKIGDKVVVLETKIKNKESYTLLDRYRLQNILYIVLAFFVLVLLISGKKGFGAILGLAISLLVLLYFIVPRVIEGNDPVFITILGSLFIILVTMYLAHGISKKVTVAVISTLISLTITGILASLFVGVSHLSGLGSEDSFLLQASTANINLRGLLLAGIIIGALGVLDDITSTQSATIFEIHQVDKSLSFASLVKKGFNVGREHIASLVNTLVLAYAGASLSLFILFSLNPAHQPYWVLLNSEVVVEEVIRTISGSIGLVLAVPITTVLAAYIATSKKFTK